MSLLSQTLPLILLFIIGMESIAQGSNIQFGIVLRNSLMENIATATVKIGGSSATYNVSQQMYVVNRTFSDEMVMVEITNKEYLPLDEKIFIQKQWSSLNIYLLKKDEPYYYSYGIKVPYIGNDKWLFVYSESKMIKAFLDSIGLKYLEYPKYVTENYKSLDSTCPSLRSTLVVYKKDGRIFPKDSAAELKWIRESNLANYAGPIISHSCNFQPAYTYTNKFMVQLLNGKDNFKRLLQCLSEWNITEADIEMAEHDQYIINWRDKSIRQGLIGIIEKLKNEHCIVWADSMVISYTIID